MSTTWKLVVVGVLSAAALVAALQYYIVREAGATAERAADRFGGGRVAALTAMVDCDGCDLAERNRAVWALGEIGDASALPVLHKHRTGGMCDHAAGLCQYELDKAIRKIDGSWSAIARLTHRSRATSPDRD